MTESEFGQPEYLRKTATDQDAQTLNGIATELNPGEMSPDPLEQAKKLSVNIQRFSKLSSEMAELMSLLSQEIDASVEQLNRLHIAVDRKKKELNILEEIETSAAALELRSRDYLQQKENLEKLMENQRTLWEEERTRRMQEEAEYLENLRVQRQREEEEYRVLWTAEKQKEKQKLEEELRILEQEGLQKQQAREKDCLERESNLKRKELEWTQLIQELEQLMIRLMRRAQPTVHSEPAEANRRNSIRDQESREQVNQGQNVFSWEFYPDDRRATLNDLEPLFGNDSSDDSGADISLLREILVSQGRKIENPNAEFLRRDPIPLIFSPEKQQN
jgi:hypothetical protein